jgi:hypothetical protein
MARLASLAADSELREWLATYATYTLYATRYLKPCLCVNGSPVYAVDKNGVDSTPLLRL